MGTSSHKKGFNLYMDARKGLPFTYKLAFFHLYVTTTFLTCYK